MKTLEISFIGDHADEDYRATCARVNEGIQLLPKPEGYTRKHTTTGPKIEVITFPRDEPAPVLVPLGPNRTRDGREARVICNNRDERRPIVALIRQSDGVEATQYYFESGRRGEYVQGLDLVGHLPPEPSKPREFWIFGAEHPVGQAYDTQQLGLKMEPLPGQIHVREVRLAVDLDEVERVYLKNVLLAHAANPEDRRAKGIMEKLGNLGLLPQ